MSSTVPTTQPNTSLRSRGAPPPRPNGTSSPARPSTRPSLTSREIYLIGYNMLSFVLWYAILVRVLYPFVMLPAVSFIESAAGEDPTTNFKDSKYFKSDPFTPEVTEMPITSVAAAVAQTYTSAEQFVAYVQSLAALEVAHAALGVVRAPLVTTVMQVASRFLLVWGVCWMFGEQLLVPLEMLGVGEAAKEALVMGQGYDAKVWNQWAYVAMLMAWSVTECVRYAYFVFFLTDKMPKGVEWMRYNGFFLLYPLGISGECWLIYHALPFAKQWNVNYYYVLVATLVIYVPGSYILYTHMMAQRRRVKKGKSKAKAHTQ